MRIIIRNLQEHIPINPRRIRLAVLKTLSLAPMPNISACRYFGIKQSVELTICLVDDKKIRKLNLRYRGDDVPTDVLSFNHSKNRREILADIVVSTQAALRNARIFKTTPPYEMYLYIIHGLLHILGYDDKNKKDRQMMRKKETLICQSIRPRR